MKNYKNIAAILVLLIVALSCAKEKDPVDLGYIGAPTNVAVGFDITQDNTGLVTIVPNAEGVASYRILFGDEEGGQPTEFAVGEVITHAYEEGNYTVSVIAVGITGLTTTVEENITVTFKAPENLEVTITQDPVNPAVVTVSATADFATVMDIYWGVEPGEEPVTVLPGQDTTHTYQESGDYVITVEAKSGGSATTLYSETITVPEASDPVNLPIDFESFTVNYAFENFGMAEATVIDNPDPSGINTSSRVAQMVKPEGAETWAGAFLTMENPIDFSTNTTFRMKVWSPKSGAIVKLKAENLENGDIGYEIDAVTTTSNAWEELEYDFSGINTAESYQKVVVFFDFDNPGDGSIYYFDDIKLVPGMVPPTSMIEDFEGDPPVFTVFGNIPDVEVLANPDPSGLNTTATTAKLTKTSGSETWAGGFFEVDTPLDLDSYSDIRIKTWSPKSGIIIKLKLENEDASITHEVDIVNATANAWEELIYDFSGAPAADYIRIVTFFDFDNPGDDSEYYFDEIELYSEGGGGPGMVIFEDFEGEAPEFSVFGNIAEIEVIPNPDPTGLNTTSTVAKLTKTAGSETWAGCFFELDAPLDIVTYPSIKVSTWSPTSGIVVKLKLENDDASITHEVDIVNGVANAWEDLVYDFSGAPSADYIRVVIFFDFENPGDDSEYYFDEYALTF